MGLGGYPGERSAIPRHAGDARHLRGESRDAWLRRDAECRCAVRRPGDRAARTRSARTRRRSISTSIRPASTRTCQWTCRSSPMPAVRSRRCSRRGTPMPACRIAPPWPTWWKQIEAWRGIDCLRFTQDMTKGASSSRNTRSSGCTRSPRGSGKARWPRDLHQHRGRPASDVGRAVFPASTGRTTG